MNSQPRWENFSEPLLQLATALGIARELLVANERRDDFLLRDERFPTPRTLGLTTKSLLALTDAYGDAAAFDLRLDDQPLLSLNPNFDDAALDRFRRRAGGTDYLVLNWSLKKKALLTQWGIEHPSSHFHLFVFPQALTRLLHQEPVALEQGIFEHADGKRKIILLAPEYSHVFNGEYCALVGKPKIADWREFTPTQDVKEARQERIHAQALDVLRWNYFGLDRITPLQLAVVMSSAQIVPRDDPLALVLYEKWMMLCILYTANQTIAPKPNAGDPVWRAIYQSDTEEREVLFGRDDELHAVFDSMESSGRSWDNAAAVGTLAEWAYGSERDQQLKSSDRLHVLQGVIARELQGENGMTNYGILVRRAKLLKEQAEQAWHTFTTKKLDVYFSQVSQVEQAIEDLVKKIDDEIQGLIKALTDNTLAAVGVIVGSFIAAVFGNKFNPVIFRLGVAIYAVYLVTIPGVIGLLALRGRYKDALARFEDRKTDFETLLPPSQVHEIVGEAVNRKKRSFNIWFGVAITVYMIVLLSLCAAFFFVPDWIRAGVIPTATP